MSESSPYYVVGRNYRALEPFGPIPLNGEFVVTDVFSDGSMDWVTVHLRGLLAARVTMTMTELTTRHKDGKIGTAGLVN